MPITLTTFHADVKAAINRGTSQDAKIPRWTRLAAKWLEQNYTFRHMVKTVRVEIDHTAQYPNVIDLANPLLKDVNGGRAVLIGADGTSETYTRFDKYPAASITGSGVGVPVGFYMDGDNIVLDTRPGSDVVYDFFIAEYTDWPTDLNASPTLLARYDNLLFHQTLMEAGIDMRDDTMFASHKGMRDEALNAIFNAEDDAKWSGMRLQMGMNAVGRRR